MMSNAPAAPLPMPLRVMLVDDHAMVRAGYERLLQWEPDLQIVGSHALADAAYDDLAARGGALDVMLMDLSLPGRGGLDMIRRVRLRFGSVRILVCSMHEASGMVAQALAAGAHGYLCKSSDPGNLAPALRRVAAGERVLCPIAQAALRAGSAGDSPHERLTAREFDVFLRVVRGESLADIAQALRISPKTAANLQTLLRRKLNADNAYDLMVIARRHRLLVD